MVSTSRIDRLERSKRRREIGRLLTAYGFLLPSFIFFTIFLIIPLIAVVYLSFTNYNIVTAPEWVGLENYARLFQDPLFWRGLRNSFLYLIVTPILIVLSIWLAIVVNRKLRGIFIFRTVYYIPAVTSVVAVGMVFELVFAEPNGLINGVLLALGLIETPINFLTHPDSTLISIMLVTIWRGIGFYMVIFLAALQAVPEELYEAAAIDGANRFQQHLYITVPGIRPAIIFVAVISSISALKVFEEIFVMTDGSAGVLDSALTLMFYLYRQGFVNLNAGYAAAIAVIFTLLTLGFSIANLRFLERGSRDDR
ncbi:MAG: sugar ABC transporter permease [Candidatus Thermofonsia Clade 1 bacterium]|uniref:Sugar ABC transporter permease n=1 Tax=Candidatus Thermofonsia Clade 1 bacterium TaxID=2364210 RepID=A0A2M8PAY2_9CHLR|nr:MAG: sugar ABC transporter permease [Candidatus Thermofonsia Clade 1 bacterium]